MGGPASARVAVVVARTVDRFVSQFDFGSVDEDKRLDALHQIAQVRAALPAGSVLIDSSFAKLDRALRLRAPVASRPDPRMGRKLARVLAALRPLALAGTALTPFIAAPAHATLASYNVGDTIFNPKLGASGTNETVIEVIGSPGYAVRTATSVIILARAVGDTYTVTPSGGGASITYTVTKIYTTTVGGTDYVTKVDVKDASNNASSQDVYNAYTAPGSQPDATDGSGSVSVNVPPPSGNEQYSDVRKAGNGGDGADGYGVEVCIPLTDICGIIGVGPKPGGNGGTLDPFSVTIASNWSGAAITNTADNLAGIKVASIGGNGGQGGDAYGNFNGEHGGTAGNGGNLTVTNNSDVSTGGANSYGMWVFSQAGTGGAGGSGYILGGGGGGGGAAAGGAAKGINNADISTNGTGAVGLLVQSLGGGGGSGGSSYGIVGSAGSGSVGGNGGTATAENYGNIVTHGNYAFGVQAQSIGGNGGNSGNSAGIVAFSGTGGGAGNGSTTSVVLGGSSGIETWGNWAHGAVSQSIGGGGGSAGWSGGAATFGGNGGSGGIGGTATITANAGAYVETHGIGSYGLYAESVGGTGGTASGTGGIFTMGGSGGSGNVGGTVSINSGATIVTHAQDARGIFAQSVGGGGGSANTSGGVVSLGGSGGSGANGGQVTITLGSASDILTEGKGADGVFAQSIGGGGGSGASSVGLVALGGTGSVGGAGGVVGATNGGSIATEGRLARGMFAQSVGGGGGSGGDGGGLVSIGGASSSGGNGGTVTLSNSGSITTGIVNDVATGSRAFSQGIFAQSVGGGGGSGGDSGGLAAIGGTGSGGGTGGAVTVTNSGLITTGGNMSSAIQAQSIGGGGGDGGSTGGVLLTIGGAAGSGNNAGTVTANISGGMQTYGNDSHGLFAQAIGGGGGNGGSSTSVSAFAGVALGGKGGAGGAGGTVDVNLTSQTVNIGGVDTTVLPQIITSGDRSRGIFAQSVGGGGGSGGFAIQTSVGAFGAASFAIGGSGGAGSQGGTVSLDGNVNVLTSGDNSQGIFAQSVGGGGGAGGFSVSAALSAGEGFSGSLAVGIGGKGGAGGVGGSVTGTSGGNITTKGMFSTGYLAQSVGGGGGAGGFNVSAAGAASDGFTVSAAIGAGGTGGGGGAGGTVNVAFDGSISTGDSDGSGSNSGGFVAQSVGGGGGTGGFNVSATLGFSGGASVGGSVGLGGNGGVGGIGGTVTARVGAVKTTGDQSTGVTIQSVGGGGGSGGFNVSGNLTGSGGFAGGIAVGLGGSGAGGGSGGVVTGSVTGLSETSGDQSDAVVIQSLGGGGGSGGFNVSGNISVGGTAAGGIAVGLGGSGGTGGSGLAATGHVQNDVITTGDQSRGVLVQSAGGGGGGGAFNISGGLAISGTASGSIGVGIGGAGGSGGAGGVVIADAKNISTSGDDSAGFIAQSIGGGGGAGGFNVTGGMNFAGAGAASIGVGLGGSGGTGGSANTVTASVVGNTVTEGDRSGAILAQSVGGGGGSGGFNVSGGIDAAGTGAASISVGIGGSGGSAGNGLGVTLNVTGAAQTGEGTDAGDRGAFSDAIVAQSIGGGGGNGGFNVSGNIAAAGTGAGQVGIGIGGHGGGGGSAGSVALNVNNGVTTNDLTRLAAVTQQDNSAGIIAQSVGGGGGNGGFNVTGGIGVAGTGAGGISVGIGGSGGTGNSAGTVTADISGITRTYGDDSLGVLAQSVGGGGGNGGFNVTGSMTMAAEGAGSINVGVGGSGGSGGSAGAVTLRINDQVSAPTAALIAALTSGDRSTAVIAQSLGGGGGNGAFNVTGNIGASGGFSGGANIGIGGMGANGGTALAATADITGMVGTSGDQSAGLLVQSVGGGGGNGGFNVTGGINVSKDGGGQIGVGIGGFGGSGGSSGAASLSLNKRTSDSANTLLAVTTDGEDSDAVIVQSLGGGGGNGGFNVTGLMSLSAGGSGTLGVGIGGFGGSGGAAGTATADMVGDIVTGGANSSGLLVQSVGGGGGNGGFNVTGGASINKSASGNIGVGIGGFGGSGGAGNTVTSTLAGDVTTLADGSSGVTVQSLGGGGGNGGFNVTSLLSISASSGASGNIGVGIGGFGGSGGAGEEAHNSITGNIVTRGSDSYGLLVQSQGGGGGNGGFNVTGNMALSMSGSAGNLGVGIGGFGGSGGSGGDVTSVMTGDIVTGAADSGGLLKVADRSSGATIQSVGGGGGNGGFNVTGNLTATMGSSVSGNIGVGIGGFGGSGGNAGTVTATQTGDVTTRGDESYGILVQSAGGGGGNGGFNVTGNVNVTKGSGGSVGVGIGGFGGTGGTGNVVTATLAGDVSTAGDHAYGATVQSLGGAGGAGGFNVTGNLSVSAGSGTSIAASVGIGGFGGGGGNANTVTGSADGTYVTTGANSNGLLVQSAGGGGGAGGMNIAGSVALSSGTAGSGSVGIGGFGGGGGNGGTVIFARTGDTFTSGANSNGVTIQSVGGGGGQGGLNISGSLSATKGNSGAVGFGLGGFGGDGGDGGNVTATITGNVIASGLETDELVPVFDLAFLEGTETEEDYSDLLIGETRVRSGGSTGVLVQSVGGGGGNGGMNVTGSIALTKSGGATTGRTAAIGIGGFGGDGGNAGTVIATAGAPSGASERVQIQGIGDNQMAFAAQSIGGGGGAGGMNISGGISTAGQLTVGIGGFGGAGGYGGDVTASADADLFVGGNNSIGFLAQSVGGGGGAGAINISGGLQGSGGKEPEVVFGIGGFGGTGNTAGTVIATQRGQVMAEGLFSYGVLAQSIGGGGGAGGLNISAAVTGAGNSAKKTEGIAIAGGVGGNGGTGADAGDVTLTSDGNVFVNTIIASGADGLEFSGVEGAIFAPGVVAQSIGGGGGAGGMNLTGSFAPKGQPIALGVGGTGGVGGDAGAVTLTRGYGADGPGTIMTFGQGSHGLVAQSIGGGGGNAGFNLVLAANKSKPKNPQLGATITVGGDGGSSGDGKDVTVLHKGDIFTHGSGANGILAQSISGGGGSGATNITGALMKDSSAVNLAIGGAGGDGGSSGVVSVTHDGVIVTDGDNSAAIRAQSIASGGGDVSAEEDLTAFIPEDLPVDVPIPIGPKNELAVGIGDVGGKGGIAGDVIVHASGILSTSGTDSIGIHAQSIGGSGGASGTISVSASGESKAGTGGGVAVNVGLEGGESGVAGDVEVTSSALIATLGERARGIFAQSIGGSGGTGGEATNGFENASNETSISVGGPGGSGSTAGTVDVTQTGRIDTQGDDADGILAQSIGGGGGAGGASGTQNLQYESGDSNTLAIAVGGSGGNGAVAQDVTVLNTGVISTSGEKSFGIRAQSIGGGGGVGGAIDSKKLLLTGTSNSLEFNVGGSGGDGSSAGDVSVTNEGLIYTTGVDAAAISANSIGGGGGDAGSILDLSVSFATSNTFKANIGGTGGTGGVAGDVDVTNRSTGGTNSGWLVTEGDGAYGIFAQSLGGSGGNSSTILSISVDGGAGSISAGFNFGNAGGTGNLAGDVHVDNSALIDTTGGGAHGILAQSIGGGGGNGGVVLSGNLNLTNPVAAPLLSIGGSGGDGGDAGDVVVDNSGTIVTRGKDAHGIVAQSIGGGGGNAGVALAVSTEPGSMIVGNTLAAVLGATVMTGTGGTGGNVTVNHSGDITVFGEGSQAIVAQSLNGGGGSLTLDFDQVAAIFADDDDSSSSAEAPDPLVAARAGGTSSTGMGGGVVTVNSTGTIGVAGEGGVAINLQSVGGGGGTMNLHGSLVAPMTAPSGLSALAVPAMPAGFTIALGGVDGTDNNGGAIDGSQTGQVVVEDQHSLGLMIQSIGGGGGRAIASLGLASGQDVAQSTITVGGTNQVDSFGGDITHLLDGTIYALGDYSIGGLLQSIGGGGGVASVTFTRDAPTTALGAHHSAVVTTMDASSMTAVALGASGGSGNNGGAVGETLTGGAVAVGDHSPALLLQSIGAGGGAVTLTGAGLPEVQLGGTDGASGSGGSVSLANNGTIGSLGVGGYGVVLQSIGGGGGAVFGDFADASVHLSNDNVGDGGSLSLLQSGDIGAYGDRSVGIVAQSLGGGGGFVDGVFAGSAGGSGASGAIDLDVDGSIVAYGLDSTAVLAQSLGSLGAGDIALLSTGDVRGGSGTGIGVSFDGGRDNLIDSSGTLSAVSGLAIKATTGNDTVENRGTIVGNAMLGEGTNLIRNNLGATFVTIDTLDLEDGAGNGTFVNEGFLEMGLRAPRFPIDLLNDETFDVPVYDDAKTALLFGTSVISQVALDGDFVQSSSGEMWYDVAFGPYASDRIDATGDATVDGTAHITLTWLQDNAPVTLIATGGTGFDNGLEVPDTIALDYSILAGPVGIQLAFTSDFGQPFLNYNEQQLGHHMDSALEVGGAAGIGQLMALLGNLTAGQEDVYRAIFDELDPESLLAPTVEAIDAARGFTGSVMNCDPTDHGDFAHCVWGEAQYHRLDRERDGDDAYALKLDSAARLRMGGAVGIAGGWLVGGALGYDTMDKLHFDGERALGTDGKAFHFGLGVGKRFGAGGRGSAGLNLAAGWQKMDMARQQDIFGPSVGTARVRTHYVGGDANVGYSFGTGPFYVRPNIDGSAIRLTLEDFQEDGLAGLGMRVDQSNKWFLTAEPKITVGAQYDVVDVSVTGGAMFSNRGQFDAPMRFIGSDRASDPAIIRTLLDDQAFLLGAQIGAKAGDRVNLSIGYQGYLGERIDSHTGSFKLRVAF